MLKVSVVVPTYKPDSGLDRLIASLDAQTMPADEFEVVFVDDGSPDDTVARLRRAQETRPNIRIERIENSGWPCRPRNVGADLAQGEFIAFMDHDDELYPDALRAAYEYAVETGADVVNGKEARSHDATWAIDTYRSDVAQSVGRRDQHALIPMNPHKLYRRAFLEEHGIRFREGGRVMWEDIFFNLHVARHASVVATMASTPYYHWFTTKGSGSTGFVRSGDEFWHWLREVLVATEETLDGDEFAMQRDQLLLHQYRSRIIASFNAAYAQRERAERTHIHTACRALQQDFGLSRLDGSLNASGRMRAHLLAADEPELLTRLAAADVGITGRGSATSVEWKDGVLHVDATVRWSDSKGRPSALTRVDGRIQKALPEELARAVPAELRDVTDEIAGMSAEIGMQSAASRIVWMAPSVSESEVVDAEDAAVALRGSVHATIDPASVVFGRALESGTWELNVRCAVGGSLTQKPLKSTRPPVAWLEQSEISVAYADPHGNLALAVGDPSEALRRVTPVRVHRDGDVLEIELHGLSGDGSVPVEVKVAPPRRAKVADFHGQAATLVASEGRGVLRIETSERKLLVRIGDHVPGGSHWWIVDMSHAHRHLRHGPKVRHKRNWRRTAGRVVRRLGLQRTAGKMARRVGLL